MKTCCFSWSIFTWNMPESLTAYTHLLICPSVSMPSARRHGERPSPNSSPGCQICRGEIGDSDKRAGFRALDIPRLTGRLSLNCHRLGLFSLMAETDKLQTSQAHQLSIHAIPSSSGSPIDLPCITLNVSLLLSFICGYLPPRSVRPVSYGSAGGRGLHSSPPGEKCAEQTDPGITQRLDTLAGYLRAASS